MGFQNLDDPLQSFLIRLGKARGDGTSISSTPMILPPERTGITISDRDALSQAMWPGNWCTSGTSWVRFSRTAVPQTPFP